jgi:hypothetical protein
MYCYDCGNADNPVPAIGVCVACGAGVCAGCAQFGTQTIHRMAGFVSAEVGNIETRALNCPRCSAAVHAHHPDAQGLVRS